MDRFRVQIPQDVDIAEACKNLCARAMVENASIEFSFNGIELKAGPITKPENLIKLYSEEQEKLLTKQA